MRIVSQLNHVVDPSATMQVVDTLVKGNKAFDLPGVRNAGHCGGGDYVGSRRKDFPVGT
jgi:hypothetical protein